MGSKVVWKDVVGWEGLYKVSNTGKIFSLTKNVEMKTHINERGYECFLLTRNENRVNSRVHRIVARAFLPNPNSYPEVNHIDGKKKNNRVENLEWCTRLQNANHAKKNGLMGKPPRGEKNGQARLTETEAEFIKRIMKSNPPYGTQKLLSRTFNISEATVSFIASHKRWSYEK